MLTIKKHYFELNKKSGTAPLFLWTKDDSSSKLGAEHN